MYLDLSIAHRLSYRACVLAIHPPCGSSTLQFFIDNVSDTHSLTFPVVAVGNAVREHAHWMFESPPCFVIQHFGPGVPDSSSSQFGRWGEYRRPDIDKH